jgi:light-regulated signal transduction histidine kinase (bacteriophytochrome)
LIDNALTYWRPQVTLRIALTFVPNDADVVVRVTDNGIGIAPEFFAKIFNVFQRLHTEEEYPGTGIGLAIVKKSVELLGRKVWVESECSNRSRPLLE